VLLAIWPVAAGGPGNDVSRGKSSISVARNQTRMWCTINGGLAKQYTLAQQLHR